MGAFDIGFQKQVARVTNAVTSQFKVPSTPKAKKKPAVSPKKKELVKNTDVFLTEGFAQHPTIKEPETRSADYYRRGRLERPGLFYTDIPKFIDEFEEEEASIRVVGKVKSSKEEQDLIPPYTKFILESVQESHAERSQIVETFGDFYVFFFGERPPVYNFSGRLINTQNINWLSDFMFYYENYLRGTRCVENNSRLVVTYSGRQIEGFMLNTGNVTEASMEKGVSMTFQVLVIDRKILQLSADFGVTEGESGSFGEDEKLLDGITKIGLSKSEVSRAYVKTKEVMEAETPPADSEKQKAADIASVANEFSIDNLVSTATGGIQKLFG